MELKELTLEEIRGIYKEHLCRDFPADELKPLDRIEVSLREGAYRCIGAYEEGAFRAYAFFVIIGDRCLLDYFGVVPSVRGKGVGTTFLKQVLSSLDMEMILIEIEDPEEGEAQIRSRRKNFYLNAGCRDTNVRFITFGVKFLLLEYPTSIAHSPEEIEEGYRGIYRAILPGSMYERNIRDLRV
jgi:GNAT superfamily N-acetyltransferase